MNSDIFGAILTSLVISGVTLVFVPFPFSLIFVAATIGLFTVMIAEWRKPEL